MPAPVASGWSGCRVGLAPTGKAPPFHGARGQQTWPVGSIAESDPTLTSAEPLFDDRPVVDRRSVSKDDRKLRSDVTSPRGKLICQIAWANCSRNRHDISAIRRR